MAKNIRYTTDNRMVIESVVKDYSAGDFIVQGILHGVSLNDVASGADAVVQAVGEVEYAKTAGATWTEGEDLYYDAVSDAFTTAITADGIVRGVAAEDALIDATSGLVKLVPGRMAADADFVAYDNATSNLVATTVQAAIDEVEDRVDDLEIEKMDLVAAPVAGNLIEVDATGQGVDSGLATADVQVLTVPTAAGNLAELTALGALADSGVASANLQVLTIPVAAHSLAGLTALGALEDTTILAADMAVAAVAGAVYGDQMRNSSDTAQSTASGTATLINLEDVELAGNVTYDAGGTSLATIPAGGTGFYAIAYNLVFAANAGTYNRAMIYVNGALRFDVEETPDTANPIVVEDYCMLKLTAGDTVALWGKHDAGAPVNVTAGYMAIQRLQ